MGIVGRERLVVGGDREAGAGAPLPREEPKPLAAVPSVPSRSISSLPDYPQWWTHFGFLGLTASLLLPLPGFPPGIPCLPSVPTIFHLKKGFKPM